MSKISQIFRNLHICHTIFKHLQKLQQTLNYHISNNISVFNVFLSQTSCIWLTNEVSINDANKATFKHHCHPTEVLTSHLVSSFSAKALCSHAFASGISQYSKAMQLCLLVLGVNFSFLSYSISAVWYYPTGFWKWVQDIWTHRLFRCCT
jgi:hypothetical protein